MCLLIFIRISAATLRGRQKKSCNFTEILKAQKLKNSHRLSSNKIFYYFVSIRLSVRPAVCPPVCPSVYKISVSVKALAGVLSHI